MAIQTWPCRGLPWWLLSLRRGRPSLDQCWNQLLQYSILTSLWRRTRRENGVERGEIFKGDQSSFPPFDLYQEKQGDYKSSYRDQVFIASGTKKIKKDEGKPGSERWRKTWDSSFTLIEHKNNPSDLGYRERGMTHEQVQWLKICCVLFLMF